MVVGGDTEGTEGTKGRGGMWGNNRGGLRGYGGLKAYGGDEGSVCADSSLSSPPPSPPQGAVAAWCCGAVGVGGAGGGRSPPGTTPPLQTRPGTPRRPSRIRRDPRQVTPPTALWPRPLSPLCPRPPSGHAHPPSPTVLEPPLIGGGSCWALKPRPFRSGHAHLV